jgi:hypothetical protein
MDFQDSLGGGNDSPQCYEMALDGIPLVFQFDEKKRNLVKSIPLRLKLTRLGLFIRIFILGEVLRMPN